VIIEPGPIKTEWNIIARENLVKVSGHSAYKNLVNKHFELMKKTDESSPDPIIVSKQIVKAILSSHPKTRYVAGGVAKFILFVKGLFCDKIFDKLVLGQVK